MSEEEQQSEAALSVIYRTLAIQLKRFGETFKSCERSLFDVVNAAPITTARRTWVDSLLIPVLGPEYALFVNLLRQTLDENINAATFTSATMRIESSSFMLTALYWCSWAMLAYMSPGKIRQNVFQRNGEPVDLYHSSSFGSFAQPFFFVTVDHVSHSIIVCIRGTSNVADVLTDILGEMVPLSDVSLDTQYVHKGFYLAARNVLDQALEYIIKYHRTYGYPIKVVGHSYGGAVATLIAFIMTRDGFGDEYELPSLSISTRSITFSSPPVYNSILCELTCRQSIHMNLFLGWDVVARASLYNMFSFFCKDQQNLFVKAYLPKNSYWITYALNGAIDGLYQLPIDTTEGNPALDSVFVNTHCFEDHSINRVYAALLSLISLRSE